MKNNKKLINEIEGLGDQTSSLFKDGKLKMAVEAGCFPKGVQPFTPQGGGEVAYVKSTKFPNFPLAYLYPDGKLEYYSNDGKNKMEKTLRWNCVRLNALVQNSTNPELTNFVDGVRNAGTADIYDYEGKDLGNKKFDGSCTLTKLSEFIESKPELKTRVDIKNLLPTSNEMYIWVCQQGAKVAVDRASIERAVKLGYHECTDLELNGNLSQIKFYSESGDGKPTLLNGKKYCRTYRDEAGLNTQLKPYRDASKGIQEQGTTKETCRAMIEAYYNAAKAGLPIPKEEIELGKTRVRDCMNNELIKLDGFLSKKFTKMEQEINYFPIKKAPNGIDTLNYRLSAGGDSVMESRLQSIIRQNLNLLSESKKKTLIEESKIITSRLSIIKEGRKPGGKENNIKFIDELLSERLYLSSQGFNKELINEEFFDIIKSFFGNAGGGVFEMIKERFVKVIIEKLTPMDPNGWVANILITAAGNIPIGDWVNGKVFNCDYISDVLSKSIAEGALRKVQNEKGAEGPIYDILRNALVSSLEDTSFGSAIENAIGDLICPMLGGVKEKLNLAADTMKEKALAG